MKSLRVLGLSLSAGLFISACSQLPASKNDSATITADLPLYQSALVAPWQVLIKSPEHLQLMSGQRAALADGLVQIQTIDDASQPSALQMNFTDHWSTAMLFSNGSMDLSDFAANGLLEFDIRVDDIQKGKIDLVVNCEDNCRQVYRLREWAQQHEGQGWQHLAIPLSCLVDSSANLTDVTKPFRLSTGGKGQLAINNIKFSPQGQANMPCYSNQQLATTPGILNEYWSVDWWLPRHNDKVAQAKLGEAQLIMIGDSITHGWENDGKAVWDKYFPDINTLNLGYGGDRTENVLWRMQHGELGNTQPKLVVMMIGTNNTGHRMDSPDAIAAGVDAIVNEITAQLPEAKVLLLAIFPRDAKRGDAMRQNNLQASKLIADIAKQRNLLFADFNQGFLTEDGTLTKEMMPDLLHPKALGYEVWARQLEPYINQYVRGK